jgi:predicted acylesterase/phospholipase RssA
MDQYSRLLIFFMVLAGASCSTKIYPDRTQFIRDGQPVPTIDLRDYRSVQERPGQDPELAVAMAISGGGSRAANFGMGIMLGLENLGLGAGQDMLDQVDYLSTVSGGGFAGGAYISALFEHDYFKRQEPFSLHNYLSRQIRDDLSRSYVAPLIKANFNPRLLFTKVDDGDALEKAIDDYVLGFQRRKNGNPGTRSIRLGDLFIPRDSSHLPVRYPMHITNSSIINNLAIFPFTPDILQCYLVDGYTHRMRIREFEELNHYRIPLAVGIKASGSFPALISNSTLRSKYHEGRPFLHLMDGAMSDNLGVYTAIDILKQETTPRKALFIVDAEAGDTPNTFNKKEGAIFSLRVLARLASSGLYARKNILPQELEEIYANDSIMPVIFSFDVLIQDNTVPPPGQIKPKKEIPRLIELMRGPEELSPEDCQVLYECLNNISTKYTIKPEEQELLLLAGQLIVRIKEEAIREAVGR